MRRSLRQCLERQADDQNTAVDQNTALDFIDGIRGPPHPRHRIMRISAPSAQHGRGQQV